MTEVWTPLTKDGGELTWALMTGTWASYTITWDGLSYWQALPEH